MPADPTLWTKTVRPSADGSGGGVWHALDADGATVCGDAVGSPCGPVPEPAARAAPGTFLCGRCACRLLGLERGLRGGERHG